VLYARQNWHAPLESLLDAQKKVGMKKQKNVK
jgi:hypothetical protein